MSIWLLKALNFRAIVKIPTVCDFEFSARFTNFLTQYSQKIASNGQNFNFLIKIWDRNIVHKIAKIAHCVAIRWSCYVEHYFVNPLHIFRDPVDYWGSDRFMQNCIIRVIKRGFWSCQEQDFVDLQNPIIIVNLWAQ